MGPARRCSAEHNQMKRFFITIAFCLAAISLVNAQELANFQRGGGRVVSPDIQGDSVTFNFRADYATQVRLQAAWAGRPIDMVRGANNVWSVKLPLPSPEIYTYNFVVDGVSVNDPQNILEIGRAHV